MAKQHPHFGASYTIAERPDGAFGVEVLIPDAALVTVTGFSTRERAGAWVADHQRQIATGTMDRPRPPWRK